MRPLPFLIGLAAALPSCSLTVARNDACTEDVECRDAFGWGSTCGANGFCLAPDPPERCSQAFPEDLFAAPERYRDRRVLGALFDGVAHLDSIQATTLAVKEANDAGGLEQRDFAVVYCDYGEGFGDDLDSIEAAATGARWMSETLGVSAIVGPRGSSRAEAAFLALEGSNVLLISPSATSPELTAIDETNPTNDNPGLLWRTAPPDDIQAAEIVSNLDERGVSSAVIIYQEGSYGDALSSLIETQFTAVGGSVTRFPYSTSPFGAVADAAAMSADEAVFISSDIADYIDFLDGAVASDNLREAYDAMGIFLPDAAFNVQLLEGVTDDAHLLFDNIRGTRYPPDEGALFDAFSAAFKTEYGADPQSSGFTAHTYDAAWLVMYGTAWAHFNESDEGGRAIARGLRRVSDGAAVPIRFSGWATVLDAFGAGTSIDVQGVSGALDYDPTTEETTAPIEVWVILETSPGVFAFGTEDN